MSNNGGNEHNGGSAANTIVVPGLEDMALKDIKDPNDADVLCGRGGAALRHPGNQTYRRLVNLNKGLYITCLKTEKLKISRSIVAAIREQKGRFLEKDNKNDTWFDIGDKKAIEKTSQALREGQPKLRQKIVEMGGGAAGAAAFIESQYGGHPGLFPAAGGGGGGGAAGGPATPQQQQVAAGLAAAAAVVANGGASAAAALAGAGPIDSSIMPPPPPPNNMSPQHMHQAQSLAAQVRQQHQQHIVNAVRQQEMQAMPPPMPQHHSNSSAANSLDTFHQEALQRLSLKDVTEGDETQQPPGSNSSLMAHYSQQQQNSRNRIRSSISSRSGTHDFGIPESQLSLLSEFSTLSGGNGMGSISTIPNNISSNGMNGINNDSFLSMEGSYRRTLSGLTGSQLGSFTVENPGSNAAMSSGGGPPSTSSINHHQHHHHHHHLGGGSGHPGGAIPNMATSSTGTVNSMSRGSTAGSSGGGGGSNHAAMDKLANVDRRRVFAKMKYNRPPSVRNPKHQPMPSSQHSLSNPQGHHLASQHSVGDGMPDIYMVDSNHSLTSNLSNMTGVESNRHLQQQQQQHHIQQQQQQQPVGVETARVVDHSGFRPGEKQQGERSGSNSATAEVLGNSGSRHSIMSGLSRISDASIDHSIFSDLSKKIGNVSTRSLAMSEISAIDMQERENEDDTTSDRSTSGLDNEETTLRAISDHHIRQQQHPSMKEEQEADHEEDDVDNEDEEDDHQNEQRQPISGVPVQKELEFHM